MTRFVIASVADDEHPIWIKDVAAKVAKCWKSPGGITAIVHWEEEKSLWHIICCPSLREIVGGKKDGEKAFPNFRMNVGKCSKIFDENPKIIFDTAKDDYPFVFFSGCIKNNRVFLIISSGPAAFQPTAELLHAQGPKKGKVERHERLLLKEEDDDNATDSE